MKEAIGGVVINEVESKPLSDYVIDFLCSQKKESPYLDFKQLINTGRGSDFPEIVKDILAFSNRGGGWILIGWNEYKKNQFLPIGLPEDFEIEQAVLQEKFNSYVKNPLEIEYSEFKRDFTNNFPKLNEEYKPKINSISERFAAIYIPPSKEELKPIKNGKYIKDGKEKIVFKKGELFFRRGTQNINPSKQELEMLKNRLVDENYRLSVLNGEHDNIEETISSNLFEVTKLPKYVYTGDKEDYDNVSTKMILKDEGIFPEFFHKFKDWNDQIVTFENLEIEDNPYRKLVNSKTIKREPIGNWLSDIDKRRVIVEILNRELKHFSIKQGLYLAQKTNMLYYPSDVEKRKETWKSRYTKSTRVVAGKMYSEQLGRFIYHHISFSPSFIEINGKFYLRVLPSFIITEDGRKPISNFRSGTIITRLSYSRYNNSYLNTVLFWIHQLGDGEDILIEDYLGISKNPVKLISHVGILHDIPSSEFKISIDDIDDEEDLNLEEEDEF